MHIAGCWLVGISLLAGCSLIDEETDVCSSDYMLDYELQLVTNMSAELESQLDPKVDAPAAAALRSFLGEVFTDYARDVDLSFYGVEEDSLRLFHDSRMMNASEENYTLYIPRHKYMHLAAANLSGNSPVLSLEDSQKCHDAVLRTPVKDTIDSFSSGIFTGRLPMDVQENVNQEFDVHMYMANSACALMLDTLGSGVKDIRLCLVGMATDFQLCDSLFVPRFKQAVRTKEININEPGYCCYAAVSFPSLNLPASKSVIETDDEDLEEGADVALWQIHAYITTEDGSVTKTVLGSRRPLKAGQFKLVRGKVFDNGVLTPGSDVFATLSIVLDWSLAMEIDVDL